MWLGSPLNCYSFTGGSRFIRTCLNRIFLHLKYSQNHISIPAVLFEIHLNQGLLFRIKREAPVLTSVLCIDVLNCHHDTVWITAIISCSKYLLALFLCSASFLLTEFLFLCSFRLSVYLTSHQPQHQHQIQFMHPFHQIFLSSSSFVLVLFLSVRYSSRNPTWRQKNTLFFPSNLVLTARKTAIP